MRSFRLLLSIVLAVYMTGAGNLIVAQETNTSPLSITLSPLQYASVNGNVGKFRALNWMKDGGDAGISDITFIKQINKDISLEAQGSVFAKTDNYSGHLTLKDGDLAFLKIDYKAFRKYYDGTGGVYPYEVISGAGHTDYGKIPDQYQAAKTISPDLQMDISFFKLEAGLGPIMDPFLDLAYEHNSKDGNKSLLQWVYTYPNLSGVPQTNSASYKKIGPAWAAINDTSDTITLKEKKEFAGITFKGEQKAEIDYNHSLTYMQYLNDTVGGSQNQLNTVNDYPTAKLFGSGVRAEKWMFNDNTYASLGYHYSHTRATDLMQRSAYTSPTLGGALTALPTNSASTVGFDSSTIAQDAHVLVGNFNSNLTPNLGLVADTRYEHIGADGNSNHIGGSTSTLTTFNTIENHQDNVAEHIGLRYYGIPHTTLYTETVFEQGRNWVSDEVPIYKIATGALSSEYALSRLDRTQTSSWTVGGRIVPNRFFTFTTQVKGTNRDDNYDRISSSAIGGATNRVILLDYLGEKGIEESSTLTWKPYHWLQNSFRYQFNDTFYTPYGELSGVTAPLGKNRMLTAKYTYEITVQPIDPLLMMLSYSHVQDYVRSIAASYPGGANYTTTPYIPTFNSGFNSWLFSATYSPTEYLTWNNSVSYTISQNYVPSDNAIPLGSSFEMLNFTTGIDWTYHKWLKLGPGYEYASYHDNPLAGHGNYSAHIFKFDVKFTW